MEITKLDTVFKRGRIVAAGGSPSTPRGVEGALTALDPEEACQQAILARARHGAASDQAGVGDGVVGRTERPDADQSGTGIEHAGHAVDLCGFEGFLKTEGGKDGGHALGQHGLP